MAGACFFFDVEVGPGLFIEAALVEDRELFTQYISAKDLISWLCTVNPGATAKRSPTRDDFMGLFLYNPETRKMREFWLLTETETHMHDSRFLKIHFDYLKPLYYSYHNMFSDQFRRLKENILHPAIQEFYKYGPDEFYYHPANPHKHYLKDVSDVTKTKMKK